jgi:CheY-like chemotaxis protein
MATVLLVDDDEGVRMLATVVLKSHGLDILSASNGLEALMVYSSYRRIVDMVLTDVDMPQMNGLELASRIRARDPGRRILLMSGRPLNESDCPPDCVFLQKPFLPDQLIAAVDGVLA